ncbi:hypothetical protein AX16_009093 [Volvariella volvacea WC 439]|nr:hypothetical protein AX16_009093 [Volvariella volvacea WC 439]
MALLPGLCFFAVAAAQLVAAQSCVPLPTSPSRDAAAAFASATYDYVIIGGGTAGLVIANRLTEDAGVTVGVIEAGYLHLDDPLVDVPGLAGQVGGNPNYDWAYSTTPQTHADGKVLDTPLGKMVGGSSGINLMGWDRGARQEYDGWGTLFSSGGWNWSNFSPYLKKVERVHEASVDPFPNQSGSADSSAYGTSGPIDSSLNTVYMGEVDPYVRAWNARGVPTLRNPYTGDKNGIFNVRVAINPNTRTRSYGASGYYCPASSRSNLKVLTQATATKILFSSNTDAQGNAIATGVQFIVDGATYTVQASREVILSAGSVHSPQLLELSGIGSASRLSGLGINSVVDLPSVGENLQDHIFAPSQFQLIPGVTTFDRLRNDPPFADQQRQQYDFNQTGWFTATDSALAFIPLQSFLSPSTINAITDALNQVDRSTLTPLQQRQWDLQLQWLTSGSVPQVEQILFSKGFIAEDGVSYFSVLSGIQHPFSRGSIHINSADPFTPPSIDPNHLQYDTDLEILGRATAFISEVANTAPLQPLVAGKQLPPSIISTIDDYKAYAKGSFGSGSHLIGTCAMADRSLGGVVDARLKVYGTANLRVADASIMPLQLAAHLQATVFAIGERAADIIKGLV